MNVDKSHKTAHVCPMFGPFFQAWEDLLKFDNKAGYSYHWMICLHCLHLSSPTLILPTCIISPTYGYDLKGLSRDKNWLWFTLLDNTGVTITTTARSAPALILNGFKYLVNWTNASSEDSRISIRLTLWQDKMAWHLHPILYHLHSSQHFLSTWGAIMLN